MDRYSKFLQISNALRAAQCDLELVTRLHLADQSTQEVVHARRAVCKKVARKRNATVLTFADIDLDALDKVYPFEQFTASDWPELFVDSAGERVTQGVGTVRKVPLTWIKKSGGQWVYAGPKVIGTAGTVLTVYRGTQAGQGAIVSSSEYTVSTATAPSGYTVLTVVFTKEQLDYSGRPYLIEADITLPGSRLPSDELARVLTAYGITYDSTSFSSAATYDNTAGFLVDALYGGKGRTGRAIVSDLCAAARSWMSQSSTGAWVLVQDSPKTAALDVDSFADEIEINEYADGDVPKTVTLAYRPKFSLDENWEQEIQRTTNGPTGDKRLQNPYIYDHTVADKYLSYWQKRLNSLKLAKGVIHAVQLANGALVNVTDDVFWRGTKTFIATGITRSTDANTLSWREYDADIYTYAAATLPTNATNGYAPDYSYTPPLAPTGLTVVSGGAAVAVDGTMTAFALVRATPPASNWSILKALATNNATGEEYPAQLRLNAGNYEARITGMRPNTAHTVIVWAVNANNVEGAPTTGVGFTSGTFSTSPDVPTALTYVGGNATPDANGIVRADALVRATPPVNYFKKLMAQVKDTSTGSVQQAQMLLNAGNYEVRFAGLMPGRAHEFTAWAVNASGDDGGLATPVAFTSATSALVPAAPLSVSIGQKQSRELVYSWAKVSAAAGAAAVETYILEKQAGAGGSWAEIWRGDGQSFTDINSETGIVYTIRVKVRDRLGNESLYTTSSSYTPVKMTDDSYIIAQGVGGVSLANTAVAQGKLNLSSWSASGSIPAGGSGGTVFGGNANLGFFPNVTPSVLSWSGGSGIAPTVTLTNNTASAQSWSASGLTVNA